MKKKLGLLTVSLLLFGVISSVDAQDVPASKGAGEAVKKPVKPQEAGSDVDKGKPKAPADRDDARQKMAAMFMQMLSGFGVRVEWDHDISGKVGRGDRQIDFQIHSKGQVTVSTIQSKK